MGIDCGVEEGPSSPVFHKKKWVVLPTSLKRPGSGETLTKCIEKKFNNKRKNDSSTRYSLQMVDLKCTVPPDDKGQKRTSVDEDDSLLIFNSTPTKKKKPKRKTIDLLSCSFRSDGNSCKKTKLNDKNNDEISREASGIKLENTLNEVSPEIVISTSVKFPSPQRVSYKPQRKLLYSCNEMTNSCIKAPTPTLNDIYKSVIMIDEADIRSSPKKNRPTSFYVGLNEFQSVTSLAHENLKECSKKADNLVSPSSNSALEKGNDSLGNCFFTEIENNCITAEKICLKSSDKNESMTIAFPASPVDNNPMDETFSNYRFTEIEEDYSWLKQNALKSNDNKAMTSSIKHFPESHSPAVITTNSCPNICNSVENDKTCSSLNKNDYSGNEPMRLESTVSYNQKIDSESHLSLNNKSDKTLLSQVKGLDKSNLTSCGGEKNNFNHTLSPQKSLFKLESAIDKGFYFPTSKECFNSLDTVSTEEFSNNHMKHDYHESNKRFNDVLNQSIASPEKDIFNTSVSKLDTTLTDIMQRLLPRRVLNPTLKSRNLIKDITGNGDSSFDGLDQEITTVLENKNCKIFDQTTKNISLPETIQDPSCFLETNETVFLTQDYLQNVKPEVSTDSSVLYYEQSFNSIILAEIKSRSSVNTCVAPLKDKEASLLERSSSSDCLMAACDSSSPDNNCDESNVNMPAKNFEDPFKSQSVLNHFNEDSNNKCSFFEHIPHNTNGNCSPNIPSGIDLKQCNIEIHSEKMLSDITIFPDQILCNTATSSLNSDLISQGCLQQFNDSFQMKMDLVSQKREMDPDFNIIEKNGLNNQEKIASHTIVNDIDFCEDKIFFQINNDKSGSENKFTNSCKSYDNESSIHGLSEINYLSVKQPSHRLHLGTINSAHVGINNETLKTVLSDSAVIFKKPLSPIVPKKSDSNFTLTTALGNSISVSEESLRKIKSIFSDDLVGTNQDNFWQPLTNSNVTTLNAHTNQIKPDKKNPAGFQPSSNDIILNDFNSIQSTLVENSSSHETCESLLNHSSRFVRDKSREGVRVKSESTDVIESCRSDFEASSEFVSTYTIDKNFDISKSSKSNVQNIKAETDIKTFSSGSSTAESFMFSSANGKNITVSDVALAKVKSKFEEILEINENEVMNNKTEIQLAHMAKMSSPIVNKTDNFMFSSASRKNIKVSKESLAKFKSKFSEIFENSLTEDKNIKELDQTPKTPFFRPNETNKSLSSRASGKHIKVSGALTEVDSNSESTLAEVRSTEVDINETCEKHLLASNKADGFMISSDAALAEVKSTVNEILESPESKVFNDIAETCINETPKISLSLFSKVHNCMFSTDHGKNVKVSQESLAKVKSKFNEIFVSHETVVMNDKAETDIIQLTKASLSRPTIADSFMFSSAIGKNMKVSEESLAKVKCKYNAILDTSETEALKNIAKTDIDQTAKQSLPKSNNSDNFIFSSASGKKINISEESLAKVKSKYSVILDSHETGAVNNEADTGFDQTTKPLQRSNKSDNLMFSSASGKNIKVSEESLAKVKSKFCEIFEHSLSEVKNTEAITDIYQTPKTSVSHLSKVNSCMFSNASGKNIKVSEESLAKVKAKYNEIFKNHETEIMNDEAETDNDQMTKPSLPRPNKNDNFMCFDAALTKVKSKFSEIFEGSLTEVKNTNAITDINQTPKTSVSHLSKVNSCMFSTARGKKIKVSEESLTTVKAKYNEIWENNETEVMDNKAESAIDQTTKPCLPRPNKNDNFMFSSASGKNIKVSNTALAKDKSKFTEIFKDSLTQVKNTEAITNINQTHKTSLFHLNNVNSCMFSNASGKNIKVSEESLAKVKAKYNEIFKNHETEIMNDEAETDNDQMTKPSLPRPNKNDNFMCFDAALTKVKSKFSEIFEGSLTEVKNTNAITDINQTPKTSVSHLSKVNSCMFSTAPGKNIKVSEESLTKVKAKYNENLESIETEVMNNKAESAIDQTIKPSFPRPNKNDNFMFSSASGKNIKVSDAALTKVKSKFSEIFKDGLTEVKNTNAITDIKQTPKTSVSHLSKVNSCMFSTARGKKIKVSEESLATVKAKYNEIWGSNETEVMNNKAESAIDQTTKPSFPRPNKNDNFMFSSASGKNIKVSNTALAKDKSQFNEISGNYLADKEDNEIKMNESQLLETSFSYFDKIDPSSFPIDESKNNEISDAVVDKMKSGLNGALKNKSTDLDVLKAKKLLCKLPNIPLTITNIKDDSFPFSSSDMKVNDEVIHGNTIEGFSFIPNLNEIECGSSHHKYLGILSSTSTGKEIRVSEDALVNVRSKFSVVNDNSLTHLLEPEKNNSNIFCCSNSLNKNLSDDTCLDPGSEHKISSDIEDCLSEIQKPLETMPSNQTTNNLTFTKVSMDKKLSISLEKNIKRSKSSHSENSTSNQPFAKKVCFQPGIVNSTQELSFSHISESSIHIESKMPFMTFTQSISQSLLDEEMDIIEKRKCARDIINQEDDRLNINIEKCRKNNDLTSNRCESQFSSEEKDLNMIYEVSEGAAAFMADCTPDRSVLSNPSSFFNRKIMKPIKLLEMEFDDVDDEIIVAAELKITPEPMVKNLTLVSNDSTNHSLDSINFRSCSTEILSIRADWRKEADETINRKLTNRAPASPGLYMTLRNKGSLKRLDDLQPLSNKEQLGLGEVLYVNSTNALNFEFYAESFFSYKECFSEEGYINVGYGFSLDLSDDNKIGLSELSRSFLLHNNVDPSLISPGWIKNHFRWIVWKLACYERAFPKHLAKRYLTPENVLHQLKYRYDREIDLAQRPAIRKILECDEPSSRRLIACVADIRNVDLSDGESSYEIELTDGWYSVWTCIDPAMKTLISRQKVKIGMKLIVQAAKLLNCAEGCDPLEVPDSIRLKLHTNCVRRVKWNAKMGFTRHPGPIRVSLSSICHNGGLVGLTTAIIARVYPLLYMSKDADGKTILRNAYAEHHASSLKENDLTLKSEELFEKLLPEVESKYKSRIIVKFDRNSITQIKDPGLLWQIVSNESDPAEIQALMTPDQLLEVRKYHELISSKIRQEVQALVKEKLEEHIPSEKAKCLLKLRLVESIGGCNALLTVWNPSEDLYQILVEKKCFNFYTLNASGIRDKVLQLSSTNQTIYKENNTLKSSKESERKVTTIYDIVVNSVSAQFGEMDVVGVVIFVKEPERPWGVTNVYLSDSQENFLMITFWTSLKTLGCDDALKPGSVVACINLQWRQGSGSYIIPSTYANEMTYFSTNPNQEYLIKEFQGIKSTIVAKGPEHFITERRRRLLAILKEREYNCKTPVSRVETPRVLKRLENLKKYGEASPLPKLSFLSSPDIHRKFRSPKSGGS